jgi:TetR/AcrR family transcriptional repressor of mexJK operon
VTTPEALGVHRLAIAEGVFMKELAERFWEMGPAYANAQLAKYLQQQSDRGILRLRDPEQAGRQFGACCSAASICNAC